MKAKLIKGYPVVDLENGSIVGRVHDLIIDPVEKKVLGLLVGEKGFLKGRPNTIFFEQIFNIGNDAITVRSRDDTIPAEEHPQIELLKDYSFLGSSVISSEGNYIARVQDFTFSNQTGEIESILLYNIRGREKINKNVLLHIEGVLNLGKDYVIANADFLSHLSEEGQTAEKIEIVAEPEDPGKTEEAEEKSTEKENLPPVEGMFENMKEVWNHLEKEISREGKELAQESKEQMKKFMLNKRANYLVRDSEGNILVEPGEKITEEIIEMAEAQNKLSTLFLSGISQEVEDSLNFLGEKLRRIFH